MKVGDEFVIGYIHDGHEHNYDTGIITWIHGFKYYPDGNINEFVVKNQGWI